MVRAIPTCPAFSRPQIPKMRSLPTRWKLASLGRGHAPPLLPGGGPVPSRGESGAGRGRVPGQRGAQGNRRHRLGRSDDLTFGIPNDLQIRFNADFWRSAMDCDALRDDQWERIKGFVPGGRKGKRGPRTDNRTFLDALLWMARSGGRWRDLPERLGDYRSVKRRYYRWIEMGVLDNMLETLAREADLEWLMIDSTIVRAHQHAAGARMA